MNKNDHTKDITKLSRIELEERIAREQKLLANKSFIARLPDKGAKIKEFYNKLNAELEKHSNIDETAERMAAMKITTTTLNSLEWNKSTTPEVEPSSELPPILENDDNSELQILASCTTNEKQIRIIKPEPSLITEEDLKEIENELPAEGELEVYSKNIITFETSHKTIVEKTFKPFYTTKTDVHKPDKEKTRKRYTAEITAATPPALQHEKTVKLSLYDSIQLQLEQKKQHDKIQAKNASERVERLNKILRNHGIDTNLPVQPNEQFSKFFSKYRSGEDHSSDSDDSGKGEIDSDLEVHDDYDEPQGGAVNVVGYS